jgi:hypothetical protein
VLAAARTPVARAEGAPPDTALGRFLEGLADSTDRYFGAAALPVDTTGLDSALVTGLVEAPRPRRPGIGFMPSFGFNRVDGPVWGGSASIGRPRAPARLEASLRHAAGPNVWLGGGEWVAERDLRGRAVRLTVAAGRATAVMDRDHTERRLATFRALFSGSDRRRYLRRDGWRATLGHESDAWRAGVGWSDQLERPLAVTTGWSLRRAGLEVPDNLAAWRGRAREVRYSAGVHLPGTPFDLDVTHATSGRRIGSDFEYRRTRVSLGADIGLGRWFSVVPQFEYGRLSGEPAPQAAFYLGGPTTLRVLPVAERGGTGLALARLDVVGLADVLALARIPHPAAFPVLLGGFVAAGATWGADPYGGSARPGVDLPHAADWVSEAGISILYQPGVPTPQDFVRFDHAWSLGRDGPEPRFVVSYTRAIDLFEPLRR